MREGRAIPLLSVRTNSETRLVPDGTIARLDLERARLLFIGRGRDARFDLSMCRHVGRVAETVAWFAPDVLHFTGLSDVGQLGALIGHRFGIPMAARIVLAPTRELADALETATGRPAVMMSRNVDTGLFTPVRRRGPHAIVNIGYVGRLSAMSEAEGEGRNRFALSPA